MSNNQTQGASVEAELLRIGAQMANVMFNLAQLPGERITYQQAETFDSLRKQWDAARRTQPAGAGAPSDTLEYRTCCDHPDCTTCAGRGGHYRLARQGAAPAQAEQGSGVQELARQLAEMTESQKFWRSYAGQCEALLRGEQPKPVKPIAFSCAKRDASLESAHPACREHCGNEETCVSTNSPSAASPAPSAAPAQAEPDDEQCDRAAALALDAVAAKMGVYWNEVNTDTNGHSAWRRALVRAGFKLAAAPAQAGVAQADERRNIVKVERSSDQSVTVAFTSARAASAFERYLAAPTQPAAPASAQTAVEHEWNQLMDALGCEDTESALAKIADFSAQPDRGAAQARQVMFAAYSRCIDDDRLTPDQIADVLLSAAQPVAPLAPVSLQGAQIVSVLAQGYRSGFFASSPQDGGGQFTLHYDAATQAEAAFMLLTNALESAQQPHSTATEGAAINSPLVCQQCGADRSKEPCGNPRDCGMIGQAYSAATEGADGIGGQNG